MARASDQFASVQVESARLLREMGLTALPIDPFNIAKRLDIELEPLPPDAGGASGMFFHVQGQFGICYPTHVASDGFVRFSVAHEIGHYRLPGHFEAVLEAGQHRSRAGFQSDNKYEREADHFAAALLMPTKPFRDKMASSGDGLGAIETLADACCTSLEATAIRFVALAQEPMAVIRSKGKHIDYAAMSNPLKDFPNIDWIRKGTPLPSNTVTATFNTDFDSVKHGRRDQGTSSLQDWFNGPYRQEIVEEVAGLGAYGKTLTVLTGMESPDEFEDEDAELERKWVPRFK